MLDVDPYATTNAIKTKTFKEICTLINKIFTLFPMKTEYLLCLFVLFIVL